MTSIQSLLKVLAFCALNASLLPHTRAQVVLMVPEDPFCRATPDMVYNGLMAVTDPICLVETDQPGCNLFGLPDCRACALMPEAVADNTPPCELLDLFNLESDVAAEVPLEDVDCEPLVPPPSQPGSSAGPVKPMETSNPAESSEEEDYVPIVIVLPTDVFIDPESSVWTDSEGSDDGEDNAAKDSTRRLRTQL